MQALDRNIPAIPAENYDQLTDTTQTEQDGNEWNRDFTI
jgi:hypothetical protein